jgi:hypothetical protein
MYGYRYIWSSSGFVLQKSSKSQRNTNFVPYRNIVLYTKFQNVVNKFVLCTQILYIGNILTVFKIWESLLEAGIVGANVDNCAW